MKELLKSVHICQSYCKNKSGTFFMAHGVYIFFFLFYFLLGLDNMGFYYLIQIKMDWLIDKLARCQCRLKLLYSFNGPVWWTHIDVFYWVADSIKQFLQANGRRKTNSRHCVAHPRQPCDSNTGHNVLLSNFLCQDLAAMLQNDLMTLPTQSM